MCGITGIVSVGEHPVSRDILAMTSQIRHRGPDDEGYLLANLQSGESISCQGQETAPGLKLPSLTESRNRFYNLALGHRRLSVLDLSPQGHGPMCYPGRKVWITYNGEVYNYLELRGELREKGYPFQTETDTEVILTSYLEWDLDCLTHFNGMWAFAIVDLEKKRIFCSRDRAGVKPFYYFYDGKIFCFASEIKAFFKVDGVEVKPNDQMVADYLFWGLHDHTNETFFKNIYQLRPGECLLWDVDGVSLQAYWEPKVQEKTFGQDDGYAEHFFRLFLDSIRLRLRSDVPIGTCLSGGLDSSSIVCLSNKLIFDDQTIDRRLVGNKQKTFSSCFNDPKYDERKFIDLVIQHTGAERNFVFPNPEELWRELSKLIWHQDEPFGSTSIYAQWNVMKLARQRDVTVLLDGQGGDELLAGYLPSFYFLMKEMLKRGDLSSFFKEICGFRKHHGSVLRQFIPSLLVGFFPKPFKPLARKIIKGDMEWIKPAFRKRYFRHFSPPVKFDHHLNNYLYQIFRWTILPALLHYEDRNSMAFSLETRLPFLDYRLVEYIFSLPSEEKIKEGVTKVVLRNAMKGILPEEIRNRKDKMGFVTPEDIWFRTILRDEIDQIINSRSFYERGYFDVDKVKETFDDHCEKRKNLSATIWRWVNLELWLRVFFDKKPLLESQKDYGNPM